MNQQNRVGLKPFTRTVGRSGGTAEICDWSSGLSRAGVKRASGQRFQDHRNPLPALCPLFARYLEEADLTLPQVYPYPAWVSVAVGPENIALIVTQRSRATSRMADWPAF